MFKRQYLVSSRPVDVLPPDFRHERLGALHVYTHSAQKLSLAEEGGRRLALIGIAVDPACPADDESAIVRRILAESADEDAFVEHLAGLTGRYAAFFASPDGTLVTGDACHLKQILHGELEDGTRVVTSSLKLALDSFGLEPTINADKRAFIASDVYAMKHGLWYGEQTLDDRFERLLVNHVLEFDTRTVRRIEIAPIDMTAEPEALIDEAVRKLEGAIEGICRRYRPMLAVTAGIDSRLLVAASRRCHDKIDYYILKNAGTDPVDIEVATNLTRRLGLPFAVHAIAPLRDDFRAEFSRDYLMPIIQPDLDHVQYYRDQEYGNDVVNINGVATEVVRCFYGVTGGTPSLDMLMQFSKYGNRSAFVRGEIAKWREKALPYARRTGLPLLDLFYWEQRIGLWGAMYRAEQDIAMEEIAPFNNRKLLLAISRVKIARRNFPDFAFFRQLIGAMWPQALEEPINPGVPYSKKLLKMNARLYATSIRMMLAYHRLKGRAERKRFHAAS